MDIRSIVFNYTFHRTRLNVMLEVMYIEKFERWFVKVHLVTLSATKPFPVCRSYVGQRFKVCRHDDLKPAKLCHFVNRKLITKYCKEQVWHL